MQLTDVEITKDQVRVVEALKQGNEANKLLQKAVALEDVEKLMEETAEAKEYQEQLKQALGESWTGEDEAATEAEMAELEDALAEEMKAELPEIPTTKLPPTATVEKEEKEKEKPVAIALKDEELPSVPKHKPVVVVKEEMEEEKQQEALIAAS